MLFLIFALKKKIPLIIALFLIGLSLHSASAVEMPFFFGDAEYPVPQNTLILDSNDTGGNVILQFGKTLAEQLYWDNASSTFIFTDELKLGGNLDMNGSSITSTTSLPFTTGAGGGNDFTVNTSQLVVEGDTGQVGIGIVDPVSPFYVYESTANVDATAGLTVNNASTGDSLLQFLLDATQRWVMGVDNSDSDKFKIASTADLDSDAVLSIDPTSGAMSLLRATLAYSGAARPTRKVTLVPEFAGATLTADGAGNSGVMISDFCSKTVGGVPDTNTGVCNTASDIHNYYSWDQSGGSAQDYDIWIRWRVPDNFDSWVANPIYVYGKRTDVTNNAVTVSVYDTAGVLENAGGTQVAGTVWTSTSIEATFAGTYTAGSYMTIQIHMVSDASDTVQVGEISLNYLSNN